MSSKKDFVPFSIENKKYGVALENFERVYRAVEITTLPNAPAAIQGVFNLRGEIIPVINIRKRFGVSEKEISLQDNILLLNFNQKRFAIIVDEIFSMITNQELLAATELYPGIDYVVGVVNHGDELAIICNLALLFQPDEEKFIIESLSELDQ